MARPLDQGFSRFEFRPGINQFPKWRGINSDVDPATIPSDQAVYLENVDIIDGIYVSRYGQSKLMATEVAGANQPIKGIYDTGTEAPMGNMLVFGPTINSLTTTLFAGYVFNRNAGTLTPVMDPTPSTGRHADLPSTAAGYTSTIYSGIQGGWYHHTDSAGTPWLGFGTTSHGTWFGANPFFFDGDGNLFSMAHYGETLDGGFRMTDTDSRIYALAIRDNKMSVRPIAHLSNVRIFDIAQQTERIIVSTGGLSIDTSADVFYMMSANKTPGELYKFDFVRGLSTINNTLPSNGASYHKIILYNGKLVLLGRTQIGWVDPATGTHTAITMPAAEFTGQNFDFGGWAIYKGILYLAVNSKPGGGPATIHIVTYDGTATATSRTAAGVGEGYGGIVVAPDGKLYAALHHFEGGTTTRLRIDVFDGSTWTNGTTLWQTVSGADATGPMVTVGGNPYKPANTVQAGNLVWDGAGFLIIPYISNVSAADARLFYTKGYDFTTLFAASYPTLGSAGTSGAVGWGHAIRFLP